MGDFRASSLATLVQMVASGAGITLLPESAIEVEVEGRCGEGVVALAFYKPKPFRTLALIWRESSPRTEEYVLLADSFR